MKSEQGTKPSNKTRKFTIRFKPEEYSKIEMRFKETTCRQISEYVRNVLLDKKNTVYFRSKSMDDFMTEMVLLRTELNAIGNNFNQLVRKINASQNASELKVLALISTKNQQQLSDKISEIKEQINKFSDEWLQYSMKGRL